MMQQCDFEYFFRDAICDPDITVLHFISYLDFYYRISIEKLHSM